jgi:hypothetical protein
VQERVPVRERVQQQTPERGLVQAQELVPKQAPIRHLRHLHRHHRYRSVEEPAQERVPALCCWGPPAPQPA